MPPCSHLLSNPVVVYQSSSSSTAMVMVVEELIRVTAPWLKTPVNLTPSLIWKKPIEDPDLLEAEDADHPKTRLFIKLVKVSSPINRLLNQPMLAKGTNKRKL